MTGLKCQHIPLPGDSQGINHPSFGLPEAEATVIGEALLRAGDLLRDVLVDLFPLEIADVTSFEEPAGYEAVMGGGPFVA